jgi:hypothetical protein
MQLKGRADELPILQGDDLIRLISLARLCGDRITQKARL